MDLEVALIERTVLFDLKLWEGICYQVVDETSPMYTMEIIMSKLFRTRLRSICNILNQVFWCL